jgi:hypothetical protein
MVAADRSHGDLIGLAIGHGLADRSSAFMELRAPTPVHG